MAFRKLKLLTFAFVSSTLLSSVGCSKPVNYSVILDSDTLSIDTTTATKGSDLHAKITVKNDTSAKTEIARVVLGVTMNGEEFSTFRYTPNIQENYATFEIDKTYINGDIVIYAEGLQTIDKVGQYVLNSYASGATLEFDAYLEANKRYGFHYVSNTELELRIKAPVIGEKEYKNMTFVTTQTGVHHFTLTRADNRYKSINDYVSMMLFEVYDMGENRTVDLQASHNNTARAYKFKVGQDGIPAVMDGAKYIDIPIKVKEYNLLKNPLIMTIDEAISPSLSEVENFMDFEPNSILYPHYFNTKIGKAEISFKKNDELILITIINNVENGSHFRLDAYDGIYVGIEDFPYDIPKGEAHIFLGEKVSSDCSYFISGVDNGNVRYKPTSIYDPDNFDLPISIDENGVVNVPAFTTRLLFVFKADDTKNLQFSSLQLNRIETDIESSIIKVSSNDSNNLVRYGFKNGICPIDVKDEDEGKYHYTIYDRDNLISSIVACSDDGASSQEQTAFKHVGNVFFTSLPLIKGKHAIKELLISYKDVDKILDSKDSIIDIEIYKRASSLDSDVQIVSSTSTTSSEFAFTDNNMRYAFINKNISAPFDYRAKLEYIGNDVTKSQAPDTISIKKGNATIDPKDFTYNKDTLEISISGVALSKIDNNDPISITIDPADSMSNIFVTCYGLVDDEKITLTKESIQVQTAATIGITLTSKRSIRLPDSNGSDGARVLIIQFIHGNMKVFSEGFTYIRDNDPKKANIAITDATIVQGDLEIIFAIESINTERKSISPKQGLSLLGYNKTYSRDINYTSHFYLNESQKSFDKKQPIDNISIKGKKLGTSLYSYTYLSKSEIVLNIKTTSLVDDEFDDIIIEFKTIDESSASASFNLNLNGAADVNEIDKNNILYEIKNNDGRIILNQEVIIEVRIINPNVDYMFPYTESEYSDFINVKIGQQFIPQYLRTSTSISSLFLYEIKSPNLAYITIDRSVITQTDINVDLTLVSKQFDSNRFYSFNDGFDTQLNELGANDYITNTFGISDGTKYDMDIYLYHYGVGGQLTTKFVDSTEKKPYIEVGTLDDAGTYYKHVDIELDTSEYTIKNDTNIQIKLSYDTIYKVIKSIDTYLYSTAILVLPLEISQ